MAAQKAKNDEEKAEDSKSPASPTTHTTTTHRTESANSDVAFDIDQIKLGEMYDGYVKLTYNYGMFVTVK